MDSVHEILNEFMTLLSPFANEVHLYTRVGQRQAAQCVGRVIRSKADYGMMIFADKRYAICSISFQL